MNVAIILAGGTGTRLGTQIPKQYIEVNDKPIIKYCLDRFDSNKMIDGILIVANPDWYEYIMDYVGPKFLGFAMCGDSRQESIKNGMIRLKEMQGGCDNVIIHDAARPNVSDLLIGECFKALEEYDGVMPVLPCNDTLYYSEDGNCISGLLNRDKVFAGQAPEAFNFKKYYDINVLLSKEELSNIRGTSEIAFKKGLTIKLIPGDEHNYKITTKQDLEKFLKEKTGEV